MIEKLLGAFGSRVGRVSAWSSYSSYIVIYTSYSPAPVLSGSWACPVVVLQQLTCSCLTDCCKVLCILQPAVRDVLLITPHLEESN